MKNILNKLPDALGLDQLGNSSKASLALILIAALAILLHGVPYYYQYGTSEIIAPVKYLRGDYTTDPSLYEHDVLEFKAATLFMRFNALLCDVLRIEPYRLEHLYFFLSAFIGFLAIFLFLRALAVNVTWAALSALWLIVFNPLRVFVYGYSYKVGSGISLGVIAFALMTFLMYAYFSRKVIVHTLFLALLYAVHPLNTFLYLGMILFFSIPEFLFGEKGERGKLVRISVWNLILLGIFAAFSIRYGGTFREAPEKMFSLISLINSKNQSGGYFFAWLNPDKLIPSLIFALTFFAFLFVAKKKRYINHRLFLFSLAVLVYVLSLCLLNYAAYELKLYSLLPLDISRASALLQPLAFVCIISVVFYRYEHENSKTIAVVALLLLSLFGLISNPLTFPLFIAFLLYAREDRIRTYNVVLFALLTLSFFVGVVDGQLALKRLTLQGQRLEFLLWISSLLVLVDVKFLDAQIRVRWLAAVLIAIVWVFAYPQGVRYRLNLYTERDRSYRELVHYIDGHTAKGDIFLAGDESFGYNGLRPSFPFFHYIGYGIYTGNLTKLEREINLVWDISLTPDFLSYVEQAGYASREGLNGYLREALQNLTVERIRTIQARYSNFKYVLLPRNVEFTEKDLPLSEVFANEGFRLFEVIGMP